MNGRKAKIIRRLAHQFARTQPQPESAQVVVERSHRNHKLVRFRVLDKTPPHIPDQVVTSRDTPRFFQKALKKLTKTMSARELVEAAVRQ